MFYTLPIWAVVVMFVVIVAVVLKGLGKELEVEVKKVLESIE